MSKKLGRPFQYQSDEERPVVVSVRVSAALRARLERYAKQSGVSITDLVREGLQWRLGQKLSQLQLDMPLLDEKSLAQMIDERVQVALEARRTARQEPLAPTVEPVEALDFDQTKYVLGALCVHGHNYRGTGQSLRRRVKRDCAECHLEQKRGRRVIHAVEHEAGDSKPAALELVGA